MLNKAESDLLSLLSENARISTSELARKLAISRSTVQNRIRKLELAGIIKGFTIIYGDDYEKDLVSAHVLIMVHQKLTARTNRELHNLSQVKSVYAISGDYDLIAVLQTETTEDLSSVLDKIGNLEGVERTNSSLILETKFTR
jgi:DNA-binding Lrp family transcriptional regulator